MYQGWITDTHTHLGGECPHKCVYCYVDSFRHRVPKYQGELRMIEKELLVNYGKGKTIFIEHCNDLFASNVCGDYIDKILAHCRKYPNNNYVFQTKNPARYKASYTRLLFPQNSLYGVTIETNRYYADMGTAPKPYERYVYMKLLEGKKFVTIEPILDFNLCTLAEWMRQIQPDFINIGADSKGHKLPEPSMEKIQALIDKLTEYGIEVKEKPGLERLRR